MVRAARELDVGLALQIAALGLGLGEVRRSTRFRGEYESDTTHTVMLSLLVAEFAESCGVNPAEAVELAIVHDLPEVYASDTCTARPLSPSELRRKAEREELAAYRIRSEVGRGSRVAKLMDRYMRQDSRPARFVRLMDKVCVPLTHAHDAGDAVRTIDMGIEEFRARAEAKALALECEYPEFERVTDMFRRAYLVAIGEYERAELERAADHG